MESTQAWLSLYACISHYSCSTKLNSRWAHAKNRRERKRKNSGFFGWDSSLVITCILKAGLEDLQSLNLSHCKEWQIRMSIFGICMSELLPLPTVHAVCPGYFLAEVFN